MSDPLTSPVQLSDVERTITDRWAKLKRSRIRLAPSAPNTRASSIGHPCLRFLYLSRTSDQQVPHDETLQAIFDVGNVFEGYVLRELEEAGIKILQRGRDFVDRTLELSGHIDARLGLPDLGGMEIVAELKSMNAHTWDRVNSIEDMLTGREEWLRRYVAQLTVYLYLSNEELGVFVLANKTTGMIKVIPLALDYAYAESLLKKAEVVRDAVRSGTPPDRLAGHADVCARCSFRAVCCPPIINEGVQFLGEEVAALLERRAELDAAASEYDAIERQLKASIAKPGEYLAGSWVIVARETERKAFSVKASKYIKREYERIEKK